MRALATVLIASLLAVASAASADSPLRVNGVDVHYNVMPSTGLPAESARQYGITQSPDRAVLIVAVRRVDADGRERTVPATIAGTVVNAAGESEPVHLRTVTEGDAVSYLAEPRIAPKDALQFDLTVTSPEIAAPIPVRFAQEFFPPQPGAR